MCASVYMLLLFVIFDVLSGLDFLVFDLVCFVLSVSFLSNVREGDMYHSCA